MIRSVRGRWPAPSRGIAVGTAMVTVLAALAVPAPATVTVTVTDPHPSALRPDGQKDSVVAGGFQATVTLITGHVARYTEAPDGHASVTVLSAPAGASPSLRGYSDPTGSYLIPNEAETLVNNGVLDRGLFDVKYLAHNGYGDDRQDAVPVVVGYEPAAGARALRAESTPLAAAKRVHELDSLNGEAIHVSKKEIRSFWKSLTGQGVSVKAANGVRKVWLDRRIKADLSESVPLIGAPQAWAAGYDGTGVKVAVLDTGIDANHPDLAGKVTGSRSFVPGVPTVDDGHGHGTHVASTIVGSGAASGGQRRGVAPGAQLFVGKVLSDGGAGDISWVIDGMEWAVNAGARVVSLSLGGGPSDGTDPSSLAVNRLTAETGALFVIAAGNSGPGRSTVSAPSAADAALSVAMTSKTDTLHDRSSRGPRYGDGALKPEIAAPGVSITAARAAGTTMGTPVDANYTTATGTSMATPHVAGAAAILAQQHPEWRADRLKATLMSTSKDAGLTVYEQGAGRLDLARAVRQQVFGLTPTVDYGTVSPTESPTLTKQVTYFNAGTAPATLRLAPALRSTEDQGVPEGSLVADASVTIPAGGSATANVTVDLTRLERGTYSGAVVATDEAGQTRLTVPVGLVRQPPLRKITTRIVGRAGQPLSRGVKPCTFLRLDDQQGSEAYTVLMFRSWDGPNVSEGTGLVPDGTYAVECHDLWSEPGSFEALATIHEPELTIGADVTLQWDLAKDVVLVKDVVTPLESNVVNFITGSSRSTATGIGYTSFTLSSYPYIVHSYITPTEGIPSIGQFRSFLEQVRSAPEAITTVQGNGTVRVNPVYATDAEAVPKFTSNQKLALASEDDLRSGRDVKGKLVIVDSEPWYPIQEEAEMAAKAGAAGVLNHVSGETPTGFGVSPLIWMNWSRVSIPVLWLDGNQWRKVAPVLDGAPQSFVEIRAQLESPFEYKLRIPQLDRIPNEMNYKVKHHELAARVTAYHNTHARVPAVPNAMEANHTFWPTDSVSMNVAHFFEAPTTRIEYYNLTGPDLLWARESVLIHPSTGSIRLYQTMGGFSTAEREQETFFQATVVPGLYTMGPGWDPTRWVSACPVCRQGDNLYVYLAGAVSATNRTQWVASNGASGTYRLERDGMPVPPEDGTPIPMHKVGAEPATYTLRTVYHDAFAGSLAATVHTDWTFRSQRPASDNVSFPYICVTKFLGTPGPCGWQPLINLNYGLDLASDETATAGRAFEFTVTPWQPAQAAPADIAGLQLEVSYSDGADWVPAKVWKGEDGTYRVLVQHPKAGQTTGAVSIRAQAWDVDGNRVSQTIERAYGLRDTSPVPAHTPEY